MPEHASGCNGLPSSGADQVPLVVIPNGAFGTAGELVPLCLVGGAGTSAIPVR